MKVVFFRRKSYPHQYSIEKVFDRIQNCIVEAVTVEKAVVPHYSSGVLPRIRNILWCRSHQGDVNHITGDIHYVALGLGKDRTILTVHDLNFLNVRNPLTRFLLKFFWLTLPMKRSAYVTVISEATKRDLLSRVKFPEERIRVIPNFYDPAFAPFPKQFNKERPRILQIGTKENKNVPRLIAALKGIDCHLVIVGALNESLRSALQEHNVSFTCLQNLPEAELIDEYRKADVVSFVSTIEGFGMPILEAQATGRVVVTSKVSSMPEVGGDAACYVDPYDIGSIREGILKVINDDSFREDLVARGFDNIQRFHLRRVASIYTDLYNELGRAASSTVKIVHQ